MVYDTKYICTSNNVFVFFRARAESGGRGGGADDAQSKQRH